MPEGDTLHRTARTLQAAIAGKVVVSLRSSKISPVGIVGRRVDVVEAIGKHLLVRFDDGRAIRSHFRMTGSVHVYAPGERFRRDPGSARLVMELGEARDAPPQVVVVAFAVPVLEVVAAPRGELPRQVTHLGPDVLAPEVDTDEAVRRLRARPDMEIGDAVLDQTAVAGIGNIYKSETLFTLGVDPFARVSSLDDRTLHAIVERARRLMHANLAGGPMRTTTSAGAGQRFWVYRRARLPCARCGAVIEMRRQGALRRSTYYCPRCQRVRARSA